MHAYTSKPLESRRFAVAVAEVFGGILGNVIEKEDGSYGSDDRTSEIRRSDACDFGQNDDQAVATDRGISKPVYRKFWV